MLIGKNIKYLRVKARMTQRELADVLGYKSATTVQKWEIGENEPPPKTLGNPQISAQIIPMDVRRRVL